jgi:hypothetical protein
MRGIDIGLMGGGPPGAPTRRPFVASPLTVAGDGPSSGRDCVDDLVRDPESSW